MQTWVKSGQSTKAYSGVGEDCRDRRLLGLFKFLQGLPGALGKFAGVCQPAVAFTERGQFVGIRREACELVYLMAQEVLTFAQLGSTRAQLLERTRCLSQLRVDATEGCHLRRDIGIGIEDYPLVLFFQQQVVVLLAVNIHQALADLTQ